MPAKRHPCTFCHVKFAKVDNLRRHLAAHLQERAFTCGQCDRAFVRRDALQRHAKVHAADNLPISVTGPAKRRARKAEQAEQAEQPQQENKEGHKGQEYYEETQPTASTSSLTLETLEELLAGNDVAPLAHAGPPPHEASVLDLSFLSDYSGQPELALLSSFLNTPASAGYPPPPSISAPIPPHTLGQPDDSSAGLDLDSELFQAWMTLFNPLSPPSPGTSGVSPALASAAIPAPSRPSKTFVYAADEPLLLPYTQEKMQRIAAVWPTKFTWSNAARPQYDDPDRSSEMGTEEMSVSSNPITPSQEFVDLCVTLYFLRFHPAFPILHRPTFTRATTSPLLLLAVVAIGSTYVGSEEAASCGRKIMAHLRLVILSSWDKRFVDSPAQSLLVFQAAMLLQTFCLLSGSRKLNVESHAFHGTMKTFARLSDLRGEVKELETLPSLYQRVSTLEGGALDRAWKGWVSRECIRRSLLAICLHESELSALFADTVPAISRLTPPGLTVAPSSLYEAGDATSWRSHLMDLVLSPHPLETSPFQCLVDISLIHADLCIFRALGSSGEELRVPLCDRLMRALGSLATLNPPITDLPRHSQQSQLVRSAHILWHSTALSLHIPTDLIEMGLGREGRVDSATIASLVEWTTTERGRLSVLHASEVLKYALLTNVHEPGLHVVRAAFSAFLALLVWISLSQPDDHAVEQPAFDLASEIDWVRLRLAHQTQEPDCATPRATEWLQRGGGYVFLAGVFGEDTASSRARPSRKMDAISLLMTARKVLPSISDWPIAKVLSDTIALLG